MSPCKCRPRELVCNELAVVREVDRIAITDRAVDLQRPIVVGRFPTGGPVPPFRAPGSAGPSGANFNISNPIRGKGIGRLQCAGFPDRFRRPAGGPIAPESEVSRDFPSGGKNSAPKNPLRPGNRRLRAERPPASRPLPPSRRSQTFRVPSSLPVARARSIRREGRRPGRDAHARAARNAPSPCRCPQSLTSLPSGAKRDRLQIGGQVEPGNRVGPLRHRQRSPLHGDGPVARTCAWEPVSKNRHRVLDPDERQPACRRWKNCTRANPIGCSIDRL